MINSPLSTKMNNVEGSSSNSKKIDLLSKVLSSKEDTSKEVSTSDQTKSKNGTKDKVNLENIKEKSLDIEPVEKTKPILSSEPIKKLKEKLLKKEDEPRTYNLLLTSR